MRLKTFSTLALIGTSLFISSCKKEGCTDPTAENYSSKAKKDDGTCVYTESPAPSYTIPQTYTFNDASGNNTVDYAGQTDRLKQLGELVTLLKTGKTTVLVKQDLLDMFANTNGNGNGKFSFTSTRQLKDKAFTADVSYIENLLKNAGTASESNAQTATDGQAGVLTTNGKTYLFDANGVDVVELCEKIMMGAVFMNQALNVYFGESKMNVDNTTAVDAANGKFYTTMQHHWDEAFGYFGVSTDFPTTIPTSFWGKYCNTQNGTINSNVDMMSNFLKGRAAIGANKLQDRDAAILAIRKEWEEIAANQAITYLNTAISAFGNDQAQFLHVLAEAYAFCYNLKYSPESTRRLSPTEHSALMAMFPDNFWETTVSDLNDIKAALDTKY